MVISPLNTIGAGRPYLTNGKISESRSMSHLQADMTLNMTWSSGYSSRTGPLQARVRDPNSPQKNFIFNIYHQQPHFCLPMVSKVLFRPRTSDPVSHLGPRSSFCPRTSGRKKTSDTGEKNGSRRPWSENTILCRFGGLLCFKHLTNLCEA